MYDEDPAAWQTKQAAWKKSTGQPAAKMKKEKKEQTKAEKRADLRAQLAALE